MASCRGKTFDNSAWHRNWPLRFICSTAQNAIKLVPELEHVEEAVLNSFDDIVTAAHGVDDIAVKVRP